MCLSLVLPLVCCACHVVNGLVLITYFPVHWSLNGLAMIGLFASGVTEHILCSIMQRWTLEEFLNAQLNILTVAFIPILFYYYWKHSNHSLNIKIICTILYLVTGIGLGTYYAIYDTKVVNNGYCDRSDSGLIIDTIVVHLFGCFLNYQIVMSVYRSITYGGTSYTKLD